MPSIEPELYKVIEPYLSLAEKIGSMHAQLVDGYINKVKIKYVGDINKYNLNHMTRSIVKGMLEPTLEESVNYVNALVIASDRGIRVTEEKNSLTVTGSKPKGSVIDTRGDHRIAMAFSLLGSVAGGTLIDNAECVSKTYPEFWDTLKSLGGEVKIDGK